MKRTLNQDQQLFGVKQVGRDEFRDLQEIPLESCKRIKRSLSNSGIAAMTLLSLALTASTRKHQSSTLCLPSLQLASTECRPPTLIPCDKNCDEATQSTSSKELATSGHSNQAALLKSIKATMTQRNSCALAEDWRKVFKPLPLPPRLPHLPPGAKATTMAR